MAVETIPEAATTQEGLSQLESALTRDLSLLGYPKRDWVLPRESDDGQRVKDVLIIGGGQCGLGVAFGLLRERVFNIQVIDQNPEGREGPWKTFARMITLRTPKYLTGMDWGIPNLTFQAWYEAQYGAQAWNDVDLIPKEQWADYLHWYRTFLGIPVQNETRAGAMVWNKAHGYFEVPVTHPGKDSVIRARKVVLATGIDGSGEWHVPPMITENLPKALYAHTREDINFEALKGKRIGVLGAGASAFDNASVALETGAKEVHLFFRRDKLTDVNAYRWAEFVGFLKHHTHLSDEARWRFSRQIIRMGQLPPADTLARAQQSDAFHLHAASPWERVESITDGVQVTTPQGTHELDFLIIGSGFITNLALRPELAHIHSDLAVWADRYTPSPEEMHEDLLRHPYLGPHFEFQEKTVGQASYVSSIFNYTFASWLSMGFAGGSISGLKYSLPKLVAGITQQLYQDDQAAYYQSLVDYDIKEFELS